MITVIRNKEELDALAKHLLTIPVIGFDIETCPLPEFQDNPDAGLSPFFSRIRCMQFSDGKNSWVVDGNHVDYSLLGQVFESDKVMKVIHNAKFEAKFLDYYGFKLVRPYDSMQVEWLLTNGKDIKIGLKATVERRGIVEELSKEEQTKFNDAELSEDQIKYAALDAEIVIPLFWQQVAEMQQMDKEYKLNLVTVSPHSGYNLSRMQSELSVVLAAMENHGFYLDTEKWLLLYEYAKERYDYLSREIHQILRNSTIKAWEAQLTADSYLKPKKTPKKIQQQIDMGFIPEAMPEPLKLKKNVTWDFDDIVTKRVKLIQTLKEFGIDIQDTQTSTFIETAKTFPEGSEKRKLLELIVELKEHAKNISTYGEDYLRHVNPLTGRIHSEIRFARSARMISTNPNLQQIPHDPRYRKAFTAPTGRKLVIGDYSQIELRIIAELCDDKKFIGYFLNNQDPHLMTAAFLFDKPEDQVEKAQRAIAKTMNFGIAYGGGAGLVAKRMSIALNRDVSFKEGKKIVEKFNVIYPSIKKKLDSFGNLGLNNGYIVNLAGRIRFLELTDEEEETLDRHEVKKAPKTQQEKMGEIQRSAKNHPIQSLSAEITSMAMIEFYNRNPFENTFMVQAVHDEIVIETDPEIAEQVKDFLVECMVTAGRKFLKKVPVEVKAEVGDDWGDKE